MTMQTMKTTASTGPTTHSSPSSSSTMGWGSTYEEVTGSEYGLVENVAWREEGEESRSSPWQPPARLPPPSRRSPFQRGPAAPGRRRRTPGR